MKLIKLLPRKHKTAILILSLFSIYSCSSEEEISTNEKLMVTCTTTMITDLANELGGDLIEINGLMGAGVDPHLYKASEGDVNKLLKADIIFYNGLHLEGKLEDVFEKMNLKGAKTIALGDCLDKEGLITSELFASNYDPHVWFSIEHWISVTNFMTKTLSDKDPKNATQYEENRKKYVEKLTQLKSEVQQSVNSLPLEKRILVTAHDAFNYFGKDFDFQVLGLQGLSTATEAGVQDMQKLATFIIENKVNAIFVESSIPKRTIESLQEAVKSKNHDVKIGGTLYSDALGSTGTIEGTYIGMYEYNVKTIVNSLK